MNKVLLTGNITKEIELKEYNNGQTKIVWNSLAVRRDKDNTNFIDFKAFNGTAELLAKYTTKGSKIAIIGELEQETYADMTGNNKTKLTVIAREIELLGNKEKKEDKQPTNDLEALKFAAGENVVEDDSDLPF